MSAIQHRLLKTFADAGVTGWLHASDIDSGSEVAGQVSCAADEPVSIASVFKLPLAVALFRAFDAGALQPTRQVWVDPKARSRGATGIGALRDPVRMSLRDLASLMLMVSDNAAADTLLELVGLDTVNSVLADLGLHRSRVVHRASDQLDMMTADVGATSAKELAALLTDPVVSSRLRVLDPLATNRSTPREMTRLLAGIWRDEVASEQSCAELRRILSLQVWPHRLSAGFPYDDVLVAGKTGTLPRLRNEVGVIEYPDGGRYAVAVFTRSASTAFTLPAADAAIGTAARLAVEHLRAARGAR